MMELRHMGVGELFNRVRYRRESFLVVRRNRPIAKITPVDSDDT